MYFELNDSQLICYKDKANTKQHEWDLSDLRIYIGVEKKRKPPTMYVTNMINEVVVVKLLFRIGKVVTYSIESCYL